MNNVVTITADSARRAAEKLREAGFGEQVEVDPDTGEVLGTDDPEGARRTLEELADETYVPPILRATNEQLTFNVGQRGAPTGSSLKLKAVEVPLLGQYRMGERVTLEIEIEVGDITFRTVRDKTTGSILGRERVHIASVEEVSEPDPA